MYTTLYILENAESIHVFKMKSREESELYRRLKEIARGRSERLVRYVDCYMLGDVSVELLKGKKVRVKGEVYSFYEGITAIRGS
jgi:uncharacterized protein